MQFPRHSCLEIGKGLVLTFITGPLHIWRASTMRLLPVKATASVSRLLDDLRRRDLRINLCLGPKSEIWCWIDFEDDQYGGYRKRIGAVVEGRQVAELHRTTGTAREWAEVGSAMSAGSAGNIALRVGDERLRALSPKWCLAVCVSLEP